jgi:hypothetical protein
LMRQLDGDLLITPFPRDRPSPEVAVLIKTVGLRLARHLPAGCFWVDTQDGRVTPPTIAIPQLKRRLLSICVIQRADANGGLSREDCRSIAAGRRSRRRSDCCVACRRGRVTAAGRSAPTQREWQQQDDDRDQTHMGNPSKA